MVEGNVQETEKPTKKNRERTEQQHGSGRDENFPLYPTFNF